MITAAITVVCPQCGNRMRASAEHVGRKGRCPTCKSLMEIKAAGEESLETVQPVTTSLRQRDLGPSSTSVSGWKSGLIGLVATVAVFLAILPVRETFVGELFYERGPVQLFIVLVTCWGLAMLAMKYRQVKRQISYAERELELIPLEIGVQITAGNVDQFLGHLGRLPHQQRLSILGRRIQGALEHFKSRNSVPEVQEYLSTQAEIDASGVDSGYTLLRAFIWVVPILGFIGTVTGISAAVAGLNTTLAEDGGAQLMQALSMVTQGLATAFDTTFLALLMAIVLLFPTESLRKAEYGMLDRIEVFANESLLRRMSDERGPIDPEDLPQVVRESLEGAFREHQRWLAQWQAQVARLGQAIGADFESAVTRIEARISETDTNRLEKYADLGRLLEDVLEKAGQSAAEWQRSEDEARSRLREYVDTVARLQPLLSENLECSREIAGQLREFWQRDGHETIVPIGESTHEPRQPMPVKTPLGPGATPGAQEIVEAMDLFEPESTTELPPAQGDGPGRTGRRSS